MRRARRSIRAVRLLAGDERIPHPLRWLVAFGLLPIPGPVDEAVLVLVAIVLWFCCRETIADAWRQAG
jgi:hypothetical protein